MDKETKKVHEKDTQYFTEDLTRAEELQSIGFIAAAEHETKKQKKHKKD